MDAPGVPDAVDVVQNMLRPCEMPTIAA